MKPLIVITILLYFTNPIFSQIDSTKLINNQNEVSKIDLISNYRNLIMDDLISQNNSKLKNHFDYLTNNFDNAHYITLYPYEKVTICLLMVSARPTPYLKS